MATPIQKSFDTPDERRTPPRGTVEIVNIGGRTVTRVTYQPGWRWSTDIKPIAGTNSCQITHFGVVLSGRLHIVMDDGAEFDVKPGDVGLTPAGHDAWVVGDQPVVFIDFGG